MGVWELRMTSSLTLDSFQSFIRDRYYKTDHARGTAATFMWFIEEVGELATALHAAAATDGRSPTADARVNLEEEFADVYAWLATLASLHGLDLEAIGRKKYGGGCPRCVATPCACPHA